MHALSKNRKWPNENLESKELSSTHFLQMGEHSQLKHPIHHKTPWNVALGMQMPTAASMTRVFGSNGHGSSSHSGTQLQQPWPVSLEALIQDLAVINETRKISSWYQWPDICWFRWCIEGLVLVVLGRQSSCCRQRYGNNILLWAGLLEHKATGIRARRAWSIGMENTWVSLNGPQ